MTNRAMIVAAPLACALALAGCQQETMAPEPVRPVQSVLLEADHADDAVAVGVVEPRYKTNIGFRVLGRLTARPVYVLCRYRDTQAALVVDLPAAVTTCTLIFAYNARTGAVGTPQRPQLMQCR